LENKIIAIHQPYFLPWLGFFSKIIRSDIFVILDNVQYPKKGGYWANRVKIIINGEAEWLTMPIIRSYSGYKNINEMKIDNSKPWRENILKTIERNYKHADFFDSCFDIIEKLIIYETDDLVSYNVNIINTLCQSLGIETSKIIFASGLTSSGKATDLLISITKELCGSAYLCGGGASKYQEDEKFKENNINLIYLNYQHPVYKQFNTKEFLKGLSVIDPIMNIGIAETAKLLKTCI
jgi:hypothetical protein